MCCLRGLNADTANLNARYRGFAPGSPWSASLECGRHRFTTAEPASCWESRPGACTASERLCASRLACRDGQREHPERHHSGEVEGADARHHLKGRGRREDEGSRAGTSCERARARRNASGPWPAVTKRTDSPPRHQPNMRTHGRVIHTTGRHAGVSKLHIHSHARGSRRAAGGSSSNRCRPPRSPAARPS
jgi:hypothetical protein